MLTRLSFILVLTAGALVQSINSVHCFNKPPFDSILHLVYFFVLAYIFFKATTCTWRIIVIEKLYENSAPVNHINLR